MNELKLISTDSHVNEPGDLWVERIDKQFRDRALSPAKTSADSIDERPMPLEYARSLPGHHRHVDGRRRALAADRLDGFVHLRQTEPVSRHHLERKAA